MNIIDILFSLLRYEILGMALDDAIKSEITPNTLVGIYNLSCKHDLAHIVSDALWKNKLLSPDLEISAKFQEKQMMAVYRSEQMNYELGKICKLLGEAKIPFIPLKGAVIRKYYPESWMRTSCDIDVLVHKEDVDLTIKLLSDSLRYNKTGHTAHDISLRAPNGIHLELHFTTVEEWRAINANKILSDIWKHAIPIERTSQYVLDDDMFYFYHVAHMAKHFENGGCGIRPFIDLWLLNHRVEHDRNKRRALLEESGLIKFADAAECLSEVWLSDTKPNDTTKAMQDYILQGGVYGNVSNRVAVGQSKRGGNAKYVFSRLFLPYNVIKDYYPRIGKYKVLLPIMEAHRWIKVITSGRTKRYINELQTGNAISDNEKDNTKNLLEQLGLL